MRKRRRRHRLRQYHVAQHTGPTSLNHRSTACSHNNNHAALPATALPEPPSIQFLQPTILKYFFDVRLDRPLLRVPSLCTVRKPELELSFIPHPLIPPRTTRIETEIKRPHQDNGTSV